MTRRIALLFLLLSAFVAPAALGQAQWGSFQRGECTADGKRMYSAEILNVPQGQTLENACASTPAKVQGQSFATPSRCNKTLVAGEWGEFDVHDTTGEIHLLPNQLPNANPNPNAPIWGFADTHNHQFANLGFGGLFTWGKPFDPGGIAAALPWCDCKGTHTLVGCPPHAANEIHGSGGLADNLGSAMTLASGVGKVDAVEAANAATHILLPGLAPGLGLPGHLVGGYPQFDGWPRWNTLDHQLAYYQWLKRAHAGGLQLMVMMAVNLEMLCEAMAITGHAPLGCDDMQAVDRQLAAAKELEAYVDKYDGGWYRIVRSPAEARQAIHKGQLAVVLGIEVANLFGCARVPNPCTNDQKGQQYVRTQLQKYYATGVRHLFAIAHTDNAFGGAAIFEDIYQLNDMFFNRDGFTVYDCSSENVNFTLSISDIEQPLFQILHSLVPRQIPSYPAKGQCNAQGLTGLGKFLIQEMMNLHMIIDIDHMSWTAADEALTMAEKNDKYPMISGHSGYIDTSTGQKKHEAQKNRGQLQRISALGGMAGVITAQGVTEQADPQHGISQYVPTWRRKAGKDGIPNDCSNSSKTFAQAYLYAVEQMGGPQKAHVALATDLMGGIYQPGPRFGDDACFGGKDGEKQAQRPTVELEEPSAQGKRVKNREKPTQNVTPTPMVQYPFTLPGMTLPLFQSRACDGRDYNAATKDVCIRTFDFNTDGLAHIGMLPDLIQDLKEVGLTESELGPLFRSAEGYIQIWENAERPRPPQP